MNIKMTLAYDGTCYFGWQKTKTGPSIQEALENALFQILRIPIAVEASSRTDRGVHAKKQVVNFFLAKETPLDRLIYSLNSALASDIRILHLESVSDDFHPTLDAVGKEYRYFIHQHKVQDPIERFYTWHIHETLDLEAMRRAASFLIGKHDFAAFTTKPAEDTIRTLFDIRILHLSESQIEIRITGDRFLYKMVRRIVGTLVAVGKKNFSEIELASLLSSPDRKKAGMTAPAHGLFLYQIYFEPSSDIQS